MKELRYLAVALGVATALGCGGDDYEIHVAAIMDHYDESSLTMSVPNVATAGESFQVEFSTWGGDCIEPSHEEIEPVKRGLRITPYARHYVGERDCTLLLIKYARRVDVVFEEPGSRVIELRGRQTTWTGDPELVSAEHVVTVEE